MSELPQSTYRQAVLELIKQASAEIIMPRFRALDESQIDKKNGTELVTIADIETERFLVPRLEELWPGSRAMGEESVAEVPGKIDWVNETAPLWIIDPIDGTRNFAAGKETFCVMIARLADGDTVESWLYHPTSDCLFWAALGDGAWKISANEATRLETKTWDGLDSSYGRMSFGFFDEPARVQLKKRADRLLTYRKTIGSAGCEYCLIADGQSDYSLFNRMKVWDHAPGALLIREAGGVLETIEGVHYLPQMETGGLISASSRPMADALREILFAPDDIKRAEDKRLNV